MDEQALRQLIEDIDALSIEGEPRSHTFPMPNFGKPADPDRYMFVTANQAGLVQLARIFLVAADSPTDTEAGARATTVDEPLIQVLDDPGDMAIGWVQRVEIVPVSDEVHARRRNEEWKRDRFALLGCAFVGLFLVFLMMSGVLLWGAIFTGNSDWLP